MMRPPAWRRVLGEMSAPMIVACGNQVCNVRSDAPPKMPISSTATGCDSEWPKRRLIDPEIVMMPGCLSRHEMEATIVEDQFLFGQWNPVHIWSGDYGAGS